MPMVLLVMLVVYVTTPTVSAACPATSGMTKVHDGGDAVAEFLGSRAYTEMQALIGHGIDVSLSSTYLLGNGATVVLLPMVRESTQFGAIAYNCQSDCALAYHYEASGRVRMTYADNAGYAWSRYWKLNSPLDVTVQSDECVDACRWGCMALCGVACVPTSVGYLVCLGACDAGCYVLCVDMCESDGGTPGGPGSGPPIANSIP